MSTRFQHFVQVDPGQERVEVDAVEHGIEIHDLDGLLHDHACQLEQRHHRFLRRFRAVVDRGLDEAAHRRADELDDRGACGNDVLGRTDVGVPTTSSIIERGEPSRGTVGVRRAGPSGNAVRSTSAGTSDGTATSGGRSSGTARAHDRQGGGISAFPRNSLRTVRDDRERVARHRGARPKGDPVQEVELVEVRRSGFVTFVGVIAR